MFIIITQIRRRSDRAKFTVTVVGYEGAQFLVESVYAKRGDEYNSATH